jgi:nitroimidazol reductase NimA-like FMN-containing flavoprotein (pyridoxamine 5'-phosphate oxidase superfamily)
MLGELTPEQINAVLFSEVVGRIGCHSEGRTYVVPITYVFDGDASMHTALKDSRSR